jgi:2-polyprenyl-6-methoxyphenol hydroxylase-like FAD-dependent oxidoreductase
MNADIDRNDTALEIAIVGAGVAGLVLATRLADLGHSLIVYEARDAAAVSSEGEFLTLAPNGMNALRAVGCCDATIAAGVETTGIELLDERGKCLAIADQSADAAEFGAPSVTISRSALARILIGRARASDVDIQFGRRVLDIVQDEQAVTLHFEAGSCSTASLVVAADGLRSDVRRIVFPAFPVPHYTGLVGTGGRVTADIPATGGRMRMSFGLEAFFGYLTASDRQVYWFSSYPEADIGEVKSPAGALRALRERHATDPFPNLTILDRVETISRTYPVFDMPPLPAWSEGRVMMIGDAAHAVGPHAGQGASMAIEDAVVLAACLSAEHGHAAAFARFEKLRRPRIRDVVRVTARNSSQKGRMGPIRRLVRNLMLPIFLPMGIKASRALFAYRADLHPLTDPAARGPQTPAQPTGAEAWVVAAGEPRREAIT